MSFLRRFPSGRKSRFAPSLLLLLPAILLCLPGCSKGPDAAFNADETKITERPEDAIVVEYSPGVPDANFIMTTTGDIDTLNPLAAEDTASSAVLSLLLSSLTSRNPHTGEITPELAKSWEISDDKLTYTFHLRRGITWSDGAPFTADDVLFTWNTIYAKETDPETGEIVVDEETGRPKLLFPSRDAYFHTVGGVEYDVKKIDDYTVSFTTAEIYAPFLLFGGGASILPRHRLESAVKDGDLLERWGVNEAVEEPQNFVSLGAFVLERYRPSERIVLKRNPNYWKYDSAGTRLPYIDRVIYQIVRDGNASNLAFAQGDTDMENIQPDQVGWIERSAETRNFRIINRGPTPSNGFIWFNLNPGSDENGKPFVEPYKMAWFQQKEFRQAISYAINRQGLVDGVLFGRGQPLYNYVSPANEAWYNPEIRTYPYNPDKARQMLLDMGFEYRGEALYGPAGNRVAFELITNKNNNVRTEMATVFKQNMTDIGIDVTLSFIDFNTLLGKIMDAYNYEACMLGLGGGAPDPGSSKDIIMSSGRLHMWHPNQKEPATEWETRLDWLMNEQGRHLDQAVRRELFFEVQEILAEQQPLIYLVTPNAYLGVKDKWRNLDIPKLGSATWNFESLYAAPSP